MSDYTLQIGSATAKTLTAHGIAEAQLLHTSRGQDTLLLTVPGPIDTAALIAPFQKIILRDPDNIIRFVGWLDSSPKQASGGIESHTYTLNGPMRWLDRTYFLSPETGGLRPLTAPGDTPDAIAALDTTIREILDRVIAEYPGEIAYIDADLDDDIFQHQISAEVRLDTKCSDALARALSYAPTSAYHWDYTTEPPTIRFQDSAKLTPDHTLTETDYQLSSGTLDPQYHLLADTVTIYWLKQKQLMRIDTVSGPSQAATLGAARTHILTLEVGNYIVPAEGLAAALHKFWSRLHVNSQATIEQIIWTHTPGQLWAYGGIFAGDWTAFCHSIQRDLYAQRQTLTLGVPPEFGVTKLSDSAEPPGKEEEETGTLTVIIMGLPTGAEAHWAIGPYAGTGSNSINDAAPGSYTAIFAPFWDSKGGRLYMADPDGPKTLAAKDTATFTANYEAISRLKLQAAGETPSSDDIDLNTEDLEGKGPAKFYELDVCVDGQPKKRKFLCTDAYDAP